MFDRFEAIVDGNDVSKAKPDPEVFLIAAKKLHQSPNDCIVIEDAQAGVEAANNANMKSVGIGDKKVLKDADHILAGTNEFTIDFIKKLIA